MMMMSLSVNALVFVFVTVVVGSGVHEMWWLLKGERSSLGVVVVRGQWQGDS